MTWSLVARRAGPGLLAVLSTLAGLLLLEAGFRVRARFASPASLGTAPLGHVPKGHPAKLGHIVRPSRDPRIVYELRPELDVVFMGARVTTNDQGFRGARVATVRTRPAVRIVGLGDSVMFGWGVNDDECYLQHLAKRLAAARRDVAWETVNTAVPGYNTVMQVRTLETKGLRFEPDLVLLNFVGNDLGLPNFVERRPDPFALERSYLLDFVRARLGGPPEPRPELIGIGPDLRRAWQEADLGRVPPEYRSLAGFAAWRRAMERLGELSREHDFAVLVLAHPAAPEFVRETARALSVPLVETETAVREHARANGIADPNRPPLTLTEADPHPSALGHEIVARVLAEHLLTSGLAHRLAERALMR